MTAISVTIPGEPIPYARARAAVHFGGGKGRYHDPKLADWLTRARLLAAQAVGNARRAGVAWPRAGARYSVLVLVVRSTHRACDVDNLAKSALDGCTGPGSLWLDDADVDDLRVVRCAPDKSEPRMVIMAQTIGMPKPMEDLDWITRRTT